VAAEDVRQMRGTDNTEQLAWMVLQAANRMQARGSKVRLIVPRAPEMTYEREPPITETELLEAEEYLVECGYVAATNIGLRWGTYTITPAGFSWLEGGLPERADRLRELAQRPGEEVAFELAVRSELEAERNRMEELEGELEEVRQELPGAPQQAAAEAEKSGFHPARSSSQTASERLPWWRRVFGS
jgi:hypothetical protein